MVPPEVIDKAPRTTRRTGLEWLAAGLIFAALTAVATWPQVPQLMTHAPGHHDTLFNMWRLSWIAQALTTAPATLFDPPIFHPATRVLAFSDAVLLQGLLAAPFLAAGLPLLPVANVIFLLGPWLSALGTFLLARDLLAGSGGLDVDRFGRDRSPSGPHPHHRTTAAMDASERRPYQTAALPTFWPAVVAGAVFGLLPFRIEHIMHLELQWSQWMPLACWALHRTVRTGRTRDGILTAVFVLAQFLSCIYYGVFLVLALALAAPILVITRRDARDAGGPDASLLRVVRVLAIGALVTIGPLVAYSAPYRANQAVMGTRSAEEIARWSATPASFVSAPRPNRMYGWTADLGISEGRFFPGVVALVLAVVGIGVGRRWRWTWMYVAMGVVSSVLAMGTNTPAYRLALALLPPLAGLRAPARFGMVASLGLAVLAAAGAAVLLARVRPRPLRHALGALLVVALGVEYASNVGPLQAWTQRPPLYARWLAQQPPGSVVDLPIARAAQLPHHEAEWSFYGRTHGHPMVNGYSGYYPRAYLDLLGAMVDFPRGDSLAALRRVDTRYIVVHQDRYQPADLLDLDARLRGTPGVRFAAHIPDPDYPVSVYTLE